MRMNKRAAAPVAAMGGDEIAIAEEGAVERDMAIEQAEHMSMDMAPPVSNKMVATMGAAESQVAAPAAPMPMAAPPAISLIQCLLLRILETPVAAASV